MASESPEQGRKAASGYRDYVEERFQGEVYGEAIFRVMADLCGAPDRARKLRVLRQLERETKEILLPAVREAGFPGRESAERTSKGEALGALLARVPWQDFMRGFQTELERFVREFEQAESLAPPGKEALLKHVTDHERALLEFVKLELAGEVSGDSLDPVIAMLRGPTAA